MSSYDHHSPSISVADRAGVRLVALGGEHDLSTVAQIAAACAGPPMPTVIDLTATTFIDSSVIAELVAAHAVNASHGFAIAANPNSHVARVLSLGLIDTILPIVDTATEAISLADFTATMRTA